MAEYGTVRTPYNFVPFSEEILIRYQSLSQLPRHDRMDPARKSGEIHVEFRAETPIYVSEGQGKSYFAKDTAGRYHIPGPTVRGMVRENMQILGFGVIRPGEDLEDMPVSEHGKLSDGMPSSHRKRWGQMETPLDYPSAILGFTRNKTAYKSRVSFGNCYLTQRPQELFPVKALLRAPVPTFCAGYVEDGKCYTQDGFRLRGYKQYWLKEAGTPPLPEWKIRTATTMRPLAKGSAFQGVIRYKNLAEDELGLLLWALQLDEGCFQTLGMGKPYGYGRVKVTIQELRELEPKELYSLQSLCKGAQRAESDAVAQYIQAYQRYATQALSHGKAANQSVPIGDREEIRDFMYLESTIREASEVSYMDYDRGEYETITTPLPRVAQLRNGETEPSDEVEEQSEAPTMDALEALRAKYNARQLR